MTGLYRYIYRLSFWTSEPDGKVIKTTHRIVEISVVANSPSVANMKAETVRESLFSVHAYSVKNWRMALKNIIERAVEVGGGTSA